MEKKSTGLVILVIILSVLIVGLSGYIIYEKLLNNNNGVDDSILNNEISGFYEATTDIKIDENDATLYSTLYLWKNGTFKYESTVMAPTGLIGNYIIEDNKLILNSLFTTNSGVGLDVTKGRNEITINDDGTLTYNDYIVDKYFSIKLEKSSDIYGHGYEDENYLYNEMKVGLMCQCN